MCIYVWISRARLGSTPTPEAISSSRFVNIGLSGSFFNFISQFENLLSYLFTLPSWICLIISLSLLFFHFDSPLMASLTFIHARNYSGIRVLSPRKLPWSHEFMTNLLRHRGSSVVEPLEISRKFGDAACLQLACWHLVLSVGDMDSFKFVAPSRKMG